MPALISLRTCFWTIKALIPQVGCVTIRNVFESEAKNCDLSQVGRNLRHQTFFEMLGNWSFNDYHKPHACEWALDFLINHLNLDMNRLSVTYYTSETEQDLETRDIWLKLGFPSHRVMPNSSGDNLWEMGSTGPRGKSTEIFYKLDNDDTNLLEIWNIVFIDSLSLETPEKKVTPLQGKFVDTGMGLERILSVLEGSHSNYDTDLFKPLISAIEKKSNVKPYGGSVEDELDVYYRILADHCRMITIALSDGIEPGRKGAGFNLRTVIKRVVTISQDVFHQEVPRYLIFDLVDETIATLCQAYPELTNDVKYIRKVLAFESKRYLNYHK